MGAKVTLIENGEAVARQARRLLHGMASNFGPAVNDRCRIKLITTSDAHSLKAAAAHWLAMQEPVDMLQI